MNGTNENLEVGKNTVQKPKTLACFQKGLAVMLSAICDVWQMG